MSHHDRAEVLHRARLMLAWRDKFGRVPVYRLHHPNGGHDPQAPHPFAAHEGRAVCDCSGFAAWCVGWHRKRPGYNAGPGSKVSGYVNTDSLWQDAHGREGAAEAVQELVRPATNPLPGDLVVYPGRFAGPIRIGVGHIGILSSVPAGLPLWSPAWWQAATVIHCSAGNAKRGSAVAETSAAIWRRRGAVLEVVGG
jgi:hypothetical protein